MTELIRVESLRPDPAAIARAAECLRGGGLVAFPTETVYGLGVHALDRTAVRRVFEAKGRPATDPLIVHIGSIDQVQSLVEHMPDSARALAARFWPGPLTLVLRRSAIVPNEVTAGLETVAVRMPSHPVASALLKAAGIPIAAPSANLFARPSPTRASHVMDDLAGRIDLIVDGGETDVGVESTVVDLSGDTPTVLRPGAVTLEMLREALPRVECRTSFERGGSAMPSPGMLQKHYSPRSPLTLYEGDRAHGVARLLADAGSAFHQGQRLGIVVTDEDLESLRTIPVSGDRCLVRSLGSLRDEATIASRLYAVLRELDAAGVDRILALEVGGDKGLGLAIRDRLRRAAAGSADIGQDPGSGIRDPGDQ